jgi:hypothetical protein
MLTDLIDLMELIEIDPRSEHGPSSLAWHRSPSAASCPFCRLHLYWMKEVLSVSALLV